MRRVELIRSAQADRVKDLPPLGSCGEAGKIEWVAFGIRSASFDSATFLPLGGTAISIGTDIGAAVGVAMNAVAEGVTTGIAPGTALGAALTFTCPN